MDEKQAKELITAIKEVASEMAKTNKQLEKLDDIELALKEIAIAVRHSGQTYFND